MSIQNSKDLVLEAFNNILSFQKGESKPIKFSKTFMNNALLGGLFPGTVLGIAGSSGHGKSTLMQTLERDIFDKSINEDCDEYLLVRNNYEMSIQKLLLRDLKVGLNMKISKILKNEFTEEQKPLVREIMKRASDPRIKYLQTPTDYLTWMTMVREFLIIHKDKKHIVITIDHIALVKQSSSGKKDAIDNFVEAINTLKSEFKNVSFIVLSQLNRNIEERVNPVQSAPKKGDLYQSDFLYQLSDVIVVVHNPYKLGLQEHHVVGKDRYEDLRFFKKSPDTKFSPFLTKGNIFYHFIKLREDDDGEISDLYIERLYNNKPSEYRQDFSNKEVLDKVSPHTPSAEDFEPFDEDSPFA